jgi:hypothetical protein
MKDHHERAQKASAWGKLIRRNEEVDNTRSLHDLHTIHNVICQQSLSSIDFLGKEGEKGAARRRHLLR